MRRGRYHSGAELKPSPGPGGTRAVASARHRQRGALQKGCDSRAATSYQAPMARIVGIIPARWGSTRFPGKPLHPIAGKPLLQHVWDQCRRAKTLDSVIIATDDLRIAEAAFAWGAEVALTNPQSRQRDRPHRGGRGETARRSHTSSIFRAMSRWSIRS